MRLSIIIPTLNEEKNVGKLLQHLQHIDDDALIEIIVVDGGSSDSTTKIVEQTDAILIHSAKGRALQMNTGAELAKGDILYFVHADSLPPLSFLKDISEAILEGNSIGCYRFKFNSNRLLLRLNAYFTRFDKEWCRGGDQTLFVTRNLFDLLDGFRLDYVIMEDFDFIKRARKKANFKIIQKDVIVSARKYDNNPYLQVQFANLIVFNMYRLGFSQKSLFKTYRKLLRWY